MSDGSFVLTGQIDDRLIIEGFKKIRSEADKAAAGIGDELQKGFNGAAKGADKAAQSTRELTKEYTRTGQEIKTAYNGVKYWLDAEGRAHQVTKEHASSLGQLVSAFRGLDGATDKSAKSFSDLAGSSGLLQGAVGGLAFAMTNALGSAIGGAFQGIKQLVSGYVDLEAQLKLAAAAAGEAGGFEKLSRSVDQVGIEAAGTSMEVAELATELIRGGMTVDQVNSSLGAIVRGAEATGTGFAEMGSVVSASLKGFGLQASDASRVVDALVQGANASATSVQGMGNAFKYASPVARILGVSVEDLGAAVGLFANAGISAEEAGVTLRNGFSKLASAAPQTAGSVNKLTGQAAEAAKAMKGLGINIYNTDGTLKPMRETLLSLKGAFEKLNPASKIRLAANLFGGEDDGAKWLAVLNQSEAEITKLTETMANSKGATDRARDAMQSFSLSMKQLGGTVDSIGLGIGKVLATAIYPFIQAANLLLGPIAALPGPVKDLTAALILLTAAYVGAKVAQQAFAAAMKQEAVQAAVAEIGALTRVIRTEMITDLGRAKDAFAAFAATVRNGQLGPAIQGLQQLAAGLRNLKAQEVTAGAAQAFTGLIGAIKGGSGQGVASIGALAQSLQQGLSAALMNSGKSADKWGRDLFMAAAKSKEAEKGLTGLALVLQGGMTQGAFTASGAFRGLGAALSGLAIGTVTVALGAVVAALGAVVGAVGGYNLAMQKAWKETEIGRQAIEEFEASMKKANLTLTDTTAIGGPFNRFMQDAASGTAELAGALVPIPGLAGLVKTALTELAKNPLFLPIAAGIDNIKRLGQGLKDLFDTAQENQRLDEVNVVFGRIRNESAAASNGAAKLTKELNNLPSGQQLDKGQTKTLTEVKTRLELASIQASKYKADLLKSAEAARVAGNPAYANELIRRANETEREIQTLNGQKELLNQAAAARGASTAAIIQEGISLEAVVEQLKAREKLNQVGMLEMEAVALQKVAQGNLTTAQAATQKEAATVNALKNEIGFIDQQLAKASAADQASAVYADLKKQRAEKVVQLYQIEAKAVEARITAERALNDVIANAPIRALSAQLEIANTQLNLSRAISELEASRYNLAKTGLDAELEGAQQRGASEREINQIKFRQAQADAAAAKARQDGLIRAQALERQILDLTQLKARYEANSKILEARKDLLTAEANLTQAVADGNEKIIAQRTAELELAKAKLGIANQDLSLLNRIQPLERQIAEAGREKARNEAQAATYASTYKAALAASAATGRPLVEILGRGATSLNEWSNSTKSFRDRMQSSDQILNQVRGQINSVNSGLNSAAGGAKAIGLYGRSSIGSYAGIGNSLLSAADSAGQFAQTGIDDVTGAAADGASDLRANMRGATREAQALYGWLAAASGLPDARWTGGPVQAGGRYRINDGPGGRSLGQEAFLSASGQLSLIQRSANSLWTAPSKGLVLPAAMTSRLQAEGILPGGPGAGQGKSGSRRIRGMGVPVRRGESGTARLERAIAVLATEVAQLRQKDWDVHVVERGNGRHRRLMDMLGGLT